MFTIHSKHLYRCSEICLRIKAFEGAVVKYTNSINAIMLKTTVVDNNPYNYTKENTPFD